MQAIGHQFIKRQHAHQRVFQCDGITLVRARGDGVQPQQRAGNRECHDLLGTGWVGDADLHGTGAQVIQVQQGIAGPVNGFATVDQAPVARRVVDRLELVVAARLADARHAAEIAISRQPHRPVVDTGAAPRRATRSVAWVGDKGRDKGRIHGCASRQVKMAAG
ncbi:hypothetical protein D3C73_1177940 [compost metagenome]